MTTNSPDLGVPIGIRVKILRPRDHLTGKVIPETGERLADRFGRVVEPSVRNRISVELEGGGGIRHLEPERVAMLLKRATGV